MNNFAPISHLSHGLMTAIVERDHDFITQHHSFVVEDAVLSHHLDFDLRPMKNIFRSGLLIFGTSDPLWKTKEWKTVRDGLHLRWFSVQEEEVWEADRE